MITQKPIPDGNGQLVYCATPSKISSKTRKILNFVYEKGYAPFHPFQAFPYELFEKNQKVGREKTIQYCLKAIEICEEFWLFGISEGTTIELEFAKKLNNPIKRIKVFENG